MVLILFLGVVEALLSMEWYQGLNPRALRSVIKSENARSIYLSILFLIGEVNIVLQSYT